MATIYKTPDGFFTKVLTENERENEWRRVLQPLNDENEPHYTPKDNLMFCWGTEKETSFEKYEREITANGKKIVVKYNWRNMHEKIYKAVRKAYETN